MSFLMYFLKLQKKLANLQEKQGSVILQEKFLQLPENVLFLRNFLQCMGLIKQQAPRSHGLQYIS